MEEESIDDILLSLATSSSQGKKTNLDLSYRSGSSLPVNQPTDNSLDKLLLDISSAPITEQKTKEIKTPQIQRDLMTDLEQIQTDQKKQKTERAKAWLQQLDPLSSEGLWFREFAKHFPSELDAALDLLQ